MIYIASPSKDPKDIQGHFSSLGLASFPLSQSPCKLVVDARHPLAARETVTLDEIAAFPFLSNTYPVSYYASYREAIQDELRFHGVRTPALVKGAQKHSALNSWGGGQQLGDCIAPVPVLAFDYMGFYDQTRNTVLDVEDFEMRFDYHLVWNPSTSKQEAASFIRVLQAIVSRSLAPGAD